MDVYRLVYEAVPPKDISQFMNGTKQVVSNSDIPEKHWAAKTKCTANPWDLYYMYRRWDDLDRKFVRKVRVEVVV